MKDSTSLLNDLRCLMAKYVGEVFTEEMRQQIRMEATGLMNTAVSEGQAMCAPFICANQGTSFCPQTEEEIDIEEYDHQVCRECTMNGGFTI